MNQPSPLPKPHSQPGRIPVLIRLKLHVRTLKVRALWAVFYGLKRLEAACNSARQSLDELATWLWLRKFSAADHTKIVGAVTELQSVNGLSSKEWLVIIARGSRFHSKPGDVEKFVQAAAIHRVKSSPAKPEIQIKNN